jgi:hypothetical protein
MEGPTDQVGFIRQMGDCVADGKLLIFKLVGFAGLEQYEAEASGIVLGVSRNSGRTYADVVIKIHMIEHDVALSTTWNAIEGTPTLRFRAGTHSGTRPEQWQYVERVDGPEFFYMIDRNQPAKPSAVH